MVDDETADVADDALQFKEPGVVLQHCSQIKHLVILDGKVLLQRCAMPELVLEINPRCFELVAHLIQLSF